MDSVKILLQDDSILVLDKPPYLVADQSETVKDKTLVDILQNDFGISIERGGLVHRLDKDTSGVIVVAKTQTALENLQAQFKDRRTKKEYLALVHGEVLEGGRVEGNIGRNPVHREKFTVLEGEGKEAVTEYKVEANYHIPSDKFGEIFDDLNKIQARKIERMNYNQFSLLRCFPQTGRTHQIRVHLKYINFSIVSDEVYGGRKIVRLDKRWCPRQFLHAAKLGFNHPVTGEWTEVESPLAEDLQKALGMLVA